jgi:hypothetical protein
MNPNLKPKFLKSKLSFFRKENLGYASVISPGDPSKALHLLNPTVVEIVEMFTGEHTLDEIKLLYAAKYNQTNPLPLGRYVDQALYILLLYDLVDLGDAAEPMRTIGEPIPKVRRLQEWDFVALRHLLNGGSFPEKESNPIIHFLHPYVMLSLYTEMILRMRVFNRREFFYAITTGSEIDFVVSFYDERPMRPLACLGIIAGTKAYQLEEGLACVLPVLIEEAAPLFHKLEWRYRVDEMNTPALRSVFETFGFKQEAIIPGEFGPGADEVVYGRIDARAPSGEAPTEQTRVPQTGGPSPELL